MRTTRFVTPAVLGALAVLVAGCGGGGSATQARSTLTLPPSTASTSSSAAPTTKAAAGASTNARGNIVKHLGEQGGVFDTQNPSQGDVLTFAIDSITPDPKCDSDNIQKPENGHFVAIHMRVSTSADLNSLMPNTTISQNDFSYIGPDNVTHTDVGTFPAFTCLSDHELFTSNPLGPGQQYTGSIVIDVPATTGTLVFSFPGQQGGWEYSF